MRKLSEIKDIEALELLADIVSPVAEIAQDDEIQKFAKPELKHTLAEIVSLIIKRHSRAVMSILAALEGVPFEEYHCDIFTLPSAVMSIVNDPVLMAFFASQGQSNLSVDSGSASEISEEDESSIS